MKKDLPQRFEEFIFREQLFSLHDPVLLAVSGGVDSVVMAHLFYACKMQFALAHVNFRLRGADSEADAEFVKTLASQFKVRFFTTGFDTEAVAASGGISIQMAARELRYSWLEQVRKEEGFHHIATAHHLDDSIETVLLNMLRGTGIHGLHGIREKQGKVVRPLLPFYKLELEAFAADHQIPYRTDASNAETEYQRNKIRLDIIPVVEKHFPDFRKVFPGNMKRWSEAGLLADYAVQEARRKVMCIKGDEAWISIPRLKLFPAPHSILFALLHDFGFHSPLADQVTNALEAQAGKQFLSATHRLIVDRHHLIISPLTSQGSSVVMVQKHDKHAQAGPFHLHFSTHPAANYMIPTAARFSSLDADLLEFPVLIRPWKQGDYFYPFGMKRKKKKVSDYLIDRKVPRHYKENILVMLSGKKIACILGERIDDRFAVAPTTKQVFCVEVTANDGH